MFFHFLTLSKTCSHFLTLSYTLLHFLKRSNSFLHFLTPSFFSKNCVDTFLSLFSNLFRQLFSNFLLKQLSFKNYSELMSQRSRLQEPQGRAGRSFHVSQDFAAHRKTHPSTNSLKGRPADQSPKENNRLNFTKLRPHTRVMPIMRGREAFLCYLFSFFFFHLSLFYFLLFTLYFFLFFFWILLFEIFFL